MNLYTNRKLILEKIALWQQDHAVALSTDALLDLAFEIQRLVEGGVEFDRDFYQIDRIVRRCREVQREERDRWLQRINKRSKQ